MTDIDKLNAIRFQKIDIKKDKIKKQPGTEDNGVEFVDFSNPQAESLGRSQVTLPDNIDGDIKFMMKMPEKVEQANLFFDRAYELLMKDKNEERAYEKAAQITQAFKDEFLMLK